MTRLDTLLSFFDLSLVSLKQAVVDAGGLSDTNRAAIESRLDHVFNLNELLGELVVSHEAALQLVVSKLDSLCESNAITPHAREQILDTYLIMGEIYSDRFIAVVREA